jgi:hypothetical protein
MLTYVPVVRTKENNEKVHFEFEFLESSDVKLLNLTCCLNNSTVTYSKL